MCNINCSCNGIAAVSSIIIGIIAAFLRYSAVITFTPAFLWVIFGIAVVYLAIALIKSPFSRASDCGCTNLPLMLTGILGTILTSIILLAVDFAATSVIGAIISGASVLFFALVISASACLVRCENTCNSYDINC